MEISFIDWLAFFAALLYLLILPGYNVIRTSGYDKKLTVAERLVASFGISAIILMVIATLIALPFSIGLNFYSLIISETLVIIITTKEVVDPIRRRIRR